MEKKPIGTYLVWLQCYVGEEWCPAVRLPVLVFAGAASVYVEIPVTCKSGWVRRLP
jgi:hypothetical protein